jgi:hypothetical protein
LTTLLTKVNASEELACVPLRATRAEEINQMSLVLATPAAFAAGLACTAAVSAP